jgi:hypothetical protein
MRPDLRSWQRFGKRLPRYQAGDVKILAGFGR